MSISPLLQIFGHAFFCQESISDHSNLREDVIQNPNFLLTSTHPPNISLFFLLSHSHILRALKYHSPANTHSHSNFLNHDSRNHLKTQIHMTKIAEVISNFTQISLKFQESPSFTILKDLNQNYISHISHPITSNYPLFLKTHVLINQINSYTTEMKI